MTPERKQYLASISKEERAIRNAIDHLKIFIRNDKDGLKNGIVVEGLKPPVDDIEETEEYYKMGEEA